MEWQRRWKMMNEEKMKNESQKKQYELLKAVSAAGINAANVFGVIFISVTMFTEVLTKTGEIVAVGLIFFFVFVPWLALYLNSDVQRAKKYKVFHLGRRGLFLNIILRQ